VTARRSSTKASQDVLTGCRGTAGLAYWRGCADALSNDLIDLSAAPVVRSEHAGDGGLAPYIEASIGVHPLSNSEINGSRDFSTAFQFGEFLGAGASFGRRHRRSHARTGTADLHF